MPETQENEQRNRLVEMARSLDRQVWSKGGFPAEERPDLDFLLPRLQINSNPSLSLLSHPEIQQLKGTPIWAQMVEEGTAESKEQHELSEEKKIAQYDSLTRTISIAESALIVPDRNLKRYLAHELATDNYSRAQTTSLEQLPEDRQTQINQFLQQFRQMGLKLEGPVQVLKNGATEHLLVDGYLVATVSGQLAGIYDEIYPTIFELVTSEIDQRNGNIGRFERDIRQQKLQIARNEQHPHFTESVFKAMELVDWRILLKAFRHTDFDYVLDLLRKESEYGEGIFARFVADMEKDEHEIENVLRAYMQRGYKNR
ncbi:hypothetical protein IPM65_06045 [Candidatus Roizmanbacteria bacterium]|nr:MAG: hypothetical protein IPM65_06045 [Candidatus Roizmanbacteria bacterium]